MFRFQSLLPVLAFLACHLLLAQPNAATPLGNVKDSGISSALTGPQAIVIRCGLGSESPEARLVGKSRRYTSCVNVIRSARTLPGNLQNVYRMAKRSPIFPYPQESRTSSQLWDKTVPVVHRIPLGKCKGQIPVVMASEGEITGDEDGKITVMLPNGKKPTPGDNDGKFTLLTLPKRRKRKTLVHHEEDRRARATRTSRVAETFVAIPENLRMSHVNDFKQGSDPHQCISYHDNCRCVEVVCPDEHFQCVCILICDKKDK